MKRHVTTRPVGVRWSAASLLLVAAAASADVNHQGSSALNGQPATKLAALSVAPWSLGGVFVHRPNRSDDNAANDPVRIYDNTADPSLFFQSNQPRAAGDDACFITDACLAGPARITGVEFAMFVNPGPNAEADFDAYCLFYDTITPDASPVNSQFLGGFFIEMRSLVGNRAYTTGLIDVRPILPDGIAVADERVFVELRFCEPGGFSRLTERATPVFAGQGVAIGSSTNTYWADLNNNAVFDASEAGSFGGPPYLANFYLALDAIIEPACPADFNHDAALNSQDFFDFLTAYLAGC